MPTWARGGLPAGVPRALIPRLQSGSSRPTQSGPRGIKASMFSRASQFHEFPVANPTHTRRGDPGFERGRAQVAVLRNGLTHRATPGDADAGTPPGTFPVVTEAGSGPRMPGPPRPLGGRMAGPELRATGAKDPTFQGPGCR